MNYEMSRGFEDFDEMKRVALQERGGIHLGLNNSFEKNISAYARLVSCYINRLADENKGGFCYVKNATIAENCSISVDTVKKSIKELVESGMIKKHDRTEYGMENGYTVIEKQERHDFYLQTARHQRGYYYGYNFIFGEEIPWHSKLLYCCLCRKADEKGISFPTRKYLANKCGMSTASVNRALRILKENGFLQSESRVKYNGGQISNCYVIVAKMYFFEKQESKKNDC
jgi:DNA-binding transcriptional regulator YhcF (GntR family)